MFSNGQPISLVLADGNLVEFENQIQSQISLSDYENGAFAKLAQAAIAEPALRTLALSLVSRRYTSVADVKAALAMGLMCASNGLPLEVVFARYATTAQVSSHNAILLGSLRANPWVGLFEDKLNFRTVFEESPRAAYFVNRSPRPGEQPMYKAQWAALGFCRVAYLPNPKATGDVLLVSGTDVQVTEAGSEFITSEQWVRALRTSPGPQMERSRAPLRSAPRRPVDQRHGAAIPSRCGAAALSQSGAGHRSLWPADASTYGSPATPNLPPNSNRRRSA